MNSFATSAQEFSYLRTTKNNQVRCEEFHLFFGVVKSDGVAARICGVLESSSSLVRSMASWIVVPAGFDDEDGARVLLTAIEDILIRFRGNKLDQQTRRQSESQVKVEELHPKKLRWNRLIL